MNKRLVVITSCMLLSIFIVGKKWVHAQEEGGPKKGKKSLLKPTGKPVKKAAEESEETEVAEEGGETKETSATSKTKTQAAKEKAIEVASKIVNADARAKILDGLQGFGVGLLQGMANDELRNSHKTQAGTVRNWEKPSYLEQEFLRSRLRNVAKGQKQFLNLEKELSSDEVLKTGVVFSGGGYRAMILTTGYMQAFQDIGLLDSTLYISTLSGSTWFLAPWVLSDNTPTPAQFKQSLIDKVNAKRFDLAALQNLFKVDFSLLVNDVLWPKFIFDQTLGSIELFGGLLAYALLYDYGNARQRQHLSDLWSKVRNGTKPFPIFTSVSMHKEEQDYIYNWYEFNPLEVRNVEHGISIETWAFGRKCDAGKTVDFAPEQSLGTLMGIFGSAYTVNLKDLTKMSQDAAKTLEQQAVSQLEQFKSMVMQTVLATLAEEQTIGKFRLWPGRMNNPWLNAPGSLGTDMTEWLTTRTELTLVDGGISFNLPLPPLLDRNLDVIIMADSSGGLQEGEVPQGELIKALEYAKRTKGYNYTLWEDLRILFNSTLSVYKDYDNPQAPVIIYLNYQKDISLFEKMQGLRTNELANTYKLKDFDPLECAKKSFCGTFNFNYTPDQLSQLAAIGEFNVRVNESQLQAIFKKIYDSKGITLPLKGRPSSTSKKPQEPQHDTGGF